MEVREVQELIIAGYVSIVRSPQSTASERLSALNSLSRIYGLFIDINVVANCLEKYGLRLSDESYNILQSGNKYDELKAIDRAAEAFFPDEYKDDLY